MRPGLSAAEDAELRRLNFLGRYGLLTRKFRERWAELRARDRRDDVREPIEHRALPDQRV